MWLLPVFAGLVKQTLGTTLRTCFAPLPPQPWLLPTGSLSVLGRTSALAASSHYRRCHPPHSLACRCSSHLKGTNRESCMGKNPFQESLAALCPEKLLVSNRLGFLIKVKEEAESLAVLSSSLWLTEGTKIWAATLIFTEGWGRGPSYLSPCSRKHPRFHSGWLFSRSPLCRRIRSRSLGRRRRWGSPLFHHLASQQSTGGTLPEWSAQPEGKISGEKLGGGPGELHMEWTEPPEHSGSTCPASTSPASHFAKGVSKQPDRDSQSDPLF